MRIIELAMAVHENAVAHGWWEGKRQPAEIIALIHSEWSEALEEARAGRPLVYGLIIEGDENCVPRITENRAEIVNLHLKPEGAAVELIDGCIRILDALGYFHVMVDDSADDLLEHIINLATEEILRENKSVAEIVSVLHYETSLLFESTAHYEESGEGSTHPAEPIFTALGIAMAWVKKQGIDPVALLLEKHEYNKTRPYKHGKKF